MRYMRCFQIRANLRPKRPYMLLLGNLAREQQARLTGTWKNLVRLVLQRFNGQASLQDIYSTISKEAPEKLATNPNWMAKVRQVLGTNEKLFTSTDRGLWALA